MMAQDCYLFGLPNELLLHVLALIPTPELLPLTTVSHRFSSLILRVLNTRLQSAATLHGHTLLLECYHPSAKLTEPPLFCTYVGTPGLDDTHAPGQLYEAAGSIPTDSLGERLGAMKGLYSRFRPHRHGKESRPARRHPAGDIPGSRTHPSSSGSPLQKYGNGDEELVRQLVTLDGHELFTQLCSVTNLVKVGPRNGLFRSIVDVEEGVLRVWRDWLKKMSEERPVGAPAGDSRSGQSEGKGKGRADANVESVQQEDKVLWVSRSRNVGLRFRVRERKIRRQTPILLYADEEVAVSYDIEYEELLVRTSHLLLALEQSLLQQESYSSKAIVFGSFG